eukprot:superscaffoldBa00003201_g16371
MSLTAVRWESVEREAPFYVVPGSQAATKIVSHLLASHQYDSLQLASQPAPWTTNNQPALQSIRLEYGTVESPKAGVVPMAPDTSGSLSSPMPQSLHCPTPQTFCCSALLLRPLLSLLSLLNCSTLLSLLSCSNLLFPWLRWLHLPSPCKNPSRQLHLPSSCQTLNSRPSAPTFCQPFSSQLSYIVNPDQMIVPITL